MIRSLNWKETIAELLVVVVGISIAFQVERWGESRREAQIHELLVDGLLSEIEQNIAQLEARIDGRESVIRAGTLLTRAVSAARESGEFNMPDVALSVARFASARTADIQLAQLESYVRSDIDATMAYRPQLLSLLTQLQSLKDQSSFYFEFRLFRPLEFLVPNFDIDRLALVDPDKVMSTEFQNTILLATQVEGLQLELEQSSLQKLREALQAIQVN